MYLALGHIQSTLADAMIKQRHGLFIIQLCLACIRVQSLSAQKIGLTYRVRISLEAVSLVSQKYVYKRMNLLHLPRSAAGRA